LLDDFILREVFSTRFSTELLKTFTEHSYFLRCLLFEWFQKCVRSVLILFLFGEMSVNSENIFAAAQFGRPDASRCPA
jgi:hypothetical protein